MPGIEKRKTVRRVVADPQPVEEFTYTNPNAMPTKVGAFLAGTTFDALSQQELWDGLLYEYLFPSFGSFSIDGVSVVECGVELSGAKTFRWTTANGTNITVNSIRIDDIGRAAMLAENLANDGLQEITITALTKTVTGQSNVWRITGTNSRGTTFTRDLTVYWYSPTYYGVGAPGLTVAQIQQLTKSVAAKAASNVRTFNPSSQKVYYAAPASWGALASILDTNGFETIGGWDRTTVDFTLNAPHYNGITVSYYVYEIHNLVSLTNFNFTFKY